jgi:hypothetical protein
MRNWWCWAAVLLALLLNHSAFGQPESDRSAAHAVMARLRQQAQQYARGGAHDQGTVFNSLSVRTQLLDRNTHTYIDTNINTTCYFGRNYTRFDDCCFPFIDTFFFVDHNPASGHEPLHAVTVCCRCDPMDTSNPSINGQY